METTEHSPLTIAEISRKLRIPKHTLRFWEKEFNGQITPHRTQGGQRRYAAEHVAVIETIKNCGREASACPTSSVNCQRGKNGQGQTAKIDVLAKPGGGGRENGGLQFPRGGREEQMMTHVLVTGGAGYLGSILCEHLLREGYRVTVIDKLIYGQHCLFQFCSNPSFDFTFGDVKGRGTDAAFNQKGRCPQFLCRRGWERLLAIEIPG